MKFNHYLIIAVSLIFLGHISANAAQKQYIVAFDNIDNVDVLKETIVKSHGILAIKYCSEAKAFIVDVDVTIYTKMELLEIHVRPNIEQKTKTKFYFSELSNPHFNNLTCN